MVDDHVFMRMALLCYIQTMSRLEEIRNQRIEKMNALVDMGINPFPAHSQKDASNQDVVDNYEDYEGKNMSLTGRIKTWREHGALVFADLEDQSGSIQIYIHEDDVNETNVEAQSIGFSDFNLIDIGDFVQVDGEITKTKRGEISIKPGSIKMLTKTLRPLPEKWEGLKDAETIFRRRYLDLTMSKESRELFERKAKFWNIQREFMTDHGFIEVETPVLEHVTGGAEAEPFVTHHNALDQDFYLRISTELYLKRLVGGGFEKIYTLGPNFRNEGIDDEHLQEYYQLEFYWAYADYRDNMGLIKDLYTHVAKELYGKTKFETRGHTFDLADEWEEIDYVKTINERFDIDIFKANEDELENILKEQGVDLSHDSINRPRLIDNLWKVIRREISGPAFLVNVPKFVSPLAKSKPDDEELTERFQVILAGSELGNGYSELNNPIDQLERFKDQQANRDAGDQEAHMLDIDYVEMLEFGMPPTAGWGHSERLFWFLEDVTGREGTLFPQMKHKVDDLSKEIYDLD